MKLRRIGAFWQHIKNNKQYLSGNITIGERKYNLMVFSNDYRKTDKQPDMLVYIDGNEISILSED